MNSLVTMLSHALLLQRMHELTTPSSNLRLTAETAGPGMVPMAIVVSASSEIRDGFFKNGDAILPESITMTMQGRFAVFSEINEVSSDTYSHFRYVGSMSDSHKGINESAK